MSTSTWFLLILLGIRATTSIAEAAFRRARRVAEAFVVESGATLELLDWGFGTHRLPSPSDTQEWEFGWGFLFGPGKEAPPSLAVYVSPWGTVLFTETNPTPISSPDTTGSAA